MKTFTIENETNNITIHETVQGADAVETDGRQHGTARHGKCHPSPAWSKTSRTHASHLQGNRDIHWLTTGKSPIRVVRIGKVHP